MSRCPVDGHFQRKLFYKLFILADLKVHLDAHFSNITGYTDSRLYFTDSIDLCNKQRCYSLLQNRSAIIFSMLIVNILSENNHLFKVYVIEAM